jgi:hypothetical protein
VKAGDWPVANTLAAGANKAVEQKCKLIKWGKSRIGDYYGKKELQSRLKRK